MRRLKRKLNQLTAKMFDVPQDVTLDIPRLTLIGGVQLYIENHGGVLHFSNELLKLAIRGGRVEVSGRELSIREIMPDQVMIEGVVEGIRYISGDR